MDTGISTTRVVSDPKHPRLLRRKIRLEVIQGPDVGNEYRSAIFYTNPDQKDIAEGLIAELEERGLDVATQLVEADTFWTGEDYHQDWYTSKGTPPSCHRYRPLWDDLPTPCPD